LTPLEPTRRLGVWLVGARGSISTCVIHGLAGLRSRRLEPIGVCTLSGPLSELPLARVENMVLAGHDVCRRDLSRSAAELVHHGILSADLVSHAAPSVEAFESRIRPGILDASDGALTDVDPGAGPSTSLPPRDQVARVAHDLESFRHAERLDRVVVVNVASTEAFQPDRAEWATLDDFERALDARVSQPASVLYAYAALRTGCPYVNFTPSRGSSIAALRECARLYRQPHCGNDGKTGETLVKTVLAPLFTARALRVLSWQGYNMLGNRDGEVLADQAHRATKVWNKNEALRSLLGDGRVHTHVGIDFVPSLQDWKTAWDFIHFEGFLGTRMSLQFTWTGSDSALAAPLVIDLARLADFADEAGEAGEMEHTASFFKAPLAPGTHDFHAQFGALQEYVRGHLAKVRPADGRTR
jgi:myo-inositol-1-phosphate synthase